MTGAQSGDRLVFALDLTTAPNADVTANFAATANGAGTISQLSGDLSAKSVLFFMQSRQ